jgi:very-short-patch-repair endonuclease
MTPEEKVLWEHLRAHQLHNLHFRRQQVIDGFIADFYCSSEGLVIEVDGTVHEKQTEYDVERDSIMRNRGLRILRIRNDEIRRDIASVLDRIASTIQTPSSLPSPLRGRGQEEGFAQE